MNTQQPHPLFKTVGILFAVYSLTYVEGFVFKSAIDLVGIPYDDVFIKAEGILMSTVRYGLLIAIGSLLPQTWVKILSIFILAIFYLNSVLSYLHIFNLYLLFSGPLDFFQF